MARPPSAALVTRLRAPTDDELGLLETWAKTPSSPFEDWTGAPPPGTEHLPRVPAPAESGALVVTDAADRVVGSIGWRPVLWGPALGSTAFELGISLRPEHRGQGHGWRAQRLLAEYLFTTTPVHRVQATTDVENLAEQRALERAGYRREGVLRQAQWRLGAYHDLAMYGRLRTDD